MNMQFMNDDVALRGNILAFLWEGLDSNIGLDAECID